jgi:isoquinoline 1-oxidoreductase beta subunit
MAKASGHVAEGQVRGLDLQIAAPGPIRSQVGRLGLPFVGPDPEIAAGAWNAPYALPGFRLRSYHVPGLAPVSSWRSVGASTAGFFLESFLDELIHAAGADPMAERLRRCDWDAARGVLEAVAEMCDWGRPLPAGTGRGVAMVSSFGVPVAEVVQVTQTDAGLRLDEVWVAADAGVVVDPITFESQVEGGVLWGLGHAINAEITYADGAAEQRNFPMGEGLRLPQVPRITVRALTDNHQIRGIGEPPVPPAAPALANAVFAATGQRLRRMPFQNDIAFV